jgi:hypothetical protein
MKANIIKLDETPGRREIEIELVAETAEDERAIAILNIPKKRFVNPKYAIKKETEERKIISIKFIPAQRSETKQYSPAKLELSF